MSGRKAFTLVELMVVVAVIALLISLLLPALKKARTVAVDAACKTNLRQLGIWGLTYAGDSKDILPHNGPSFYGYRGLGDETAWWQVITKSKYGYRQFKKVLHDPQADRSVKPYMDGTIDNYHSLYDFRAYELNLYLGAQSPDHTPQPWIAKDLPARPSTAHLNAHQFWFGDSAGFFVGGGRYWVDFPSNLVADGRGSLTDKFNTRNCWPWRPEFQDSHPNNHANFVMGDGHVEDRTYDEIRNTTGDAIGLWKKGPR